ncbi:MAG: hypothetical protein OS112_10325 [Methanoregula sp.]|nr:MAG: hypothetical protein OS112_10325 [Methanoregula sp.]
MDDDRKLLIKGNVLLALLLAAMVVIPTAAAENGTNINGFEPVRNENGTVTIDGITLPVVESRAYPINTSEFDAPLTREQFIAGNQRYIAFLTEQLGKEQAETMVNDEFDRITNASKMRADTAPATVPLQSPSAPPPQPAPLSAIPAIGACVTISVFSITRRI